MKNTEIHGTISVKKVSSRWSCDVTVTIDSGDKFHGKLLLDGAGFMSPLAKKFGLRKEATEIRSTSRTLFTHADGLKHYDKLDGVQQPFQRYGYHDGTVHHIFKGGWFWVIPFDNAPGSENKGASIGLSLDTTSVRLIIE
jgi:FADH2 O2-dependent halogenase